MIPIDFQSAKVDETQVEALGDAGLFPRMEAMARNLPWNCRSPPCTLFLANLCFVLRHAASPLPTMRFARSA
jgi:hypothetical protein